MDVSVDQMREDSCMRRLPSDLQARVLELLPPNECALVGRFVSKTVSRHLNQLHHRTARVGLPITPSAAVGDPAWQPHLRQALKQLTFHHKALVLTAAASSGSQLNLELAWGLLRPCLHPELLSRPQVNEVGHFYAGWTGESPGRAAVRAGHAHLLPWLVQSKCPANTGLTLRAAAEHCDLAGLQQAWQVLGGSVAAGPSRFGPLVLLLPLLHGAGQSSVQPAAKLSWVLSLAGDATSQQDSHGLLVAAAEGAAAGWHMSLLQQLRALGLDLCDPDDGGDVMEKALQHGHVAVADWLVDEAGCALPPWGEEEDVDYEIWQRIERLWEAAARGGSVESMRRLLRRGLPACQEAYSSAISDGHLTRCASCPVRRCWSAMRGA